MEASVNDNVSDNIFMKIRWKENFIESFLQTFISLYQTMKNNIFDTMNVNIDECLELIASMYQTAAEL